MKDKKETAHEVPVQEQYVEKFKNLSEIKINISVDINDLNKNDIEDILTEFSNSAHNFYLKLANKIKNMP